jgi:hypothetical protein
VHQAYGNYICLSSITAIVSAASFVVFRLRIVGHPGEPLKKSASAAAFAGSYLWLLVIVTTYGADHAQISDPLIEALVSWPAYATARAFSFVLALPVNSMLLGMDIGYLVFFVASAVASWVFFGSFRRTAALTTGALVLLEAFLYAFDFHEWNLHFSQASVLLHIGWLTNQYLAEIGLAAFSVCAASTVLERVPESRRASTG